MCLCVSFVFVLLSVYVCCWLKRERETVSERFTLEAVRFSIVVVLYPFLSTCIYVTTYRNTKEFNI